MFDVLSQPGQMIGEGVEWKKIYQARYRSPWPSYTRDLIFTMACWAILSEHSAFFQNKICRRSIMVTTDYDQLHYALITTYNERSNSWVSLSADVYAGGTYCVMPVSTNQSWVKPVSKCPCLLVSLSDWLLGAHRKQYVRVGTPTNCRSPWCGRVTGGGNSPLFPMLSPPSGHSEN